MKRSKILLGTLGVALVVASCSSGGSDSESTDATIAPVVTDDPPPEALSDTLAPSTDDATPSDTKANDTTAPDPAAVPVVVPEALLFTAPAVGGGEIDASSFAGKPTVFWFWAPT